MTQVTPTEVSPSSPAESPEESTTTVDWARLVDWAVALLLIVTSALKAFSPAEAVSVASAYGISYPLMMLVVQVELFNAAMLLSGRWPRAARTLASLLFSTFAVFSLFLAINGHSSCGCFGQLKTDPRVVFGVDIAVLLALQWNLRSSRQAVQSRSRWTWVAIYAGLGSIAFVLMLFNTPAVLSGNEFIDETADLVILEPEKWVGKPFPLTSFLTPKVRFSSGKSTILIYHHDCPDCQRAVPRYVDLAEKRDPDSGRIVLLEVPPLGETPDHGKAVHATLSEERQWFVTAPVEIQLDGTTVTGVIDPAAMFSKD